jgi:PAS domain S-box-containing protein
MTKSDQTASAAGQLGWPKAGTERAARSGESVFGASLTVCGLVVLLLLLGVGVSWFLESTSLRKTLESVQVGSTGQSPAEHLARMDQRQLVIMIATAGLGVILVLLMFHNSRQRKNERKAALVRREADWKSEVTNLRLELTTRARGEREARLAQEKLKAELEELSQATAKMNEELDRHRQAEKFYSQQRSELVRSKDVLELHVQARTQELEKLQRRSELILNSAGEGICGLDLTGRITFANPAAARIMKLTVEDLVGRPESNVFAGFRTDLPAGGNGSRPAEILATRHDGSTYVAEYVRSPLTENGRSIGAVILFKDISERKRAEEALSEKAVELARSNSELEQFAFVASHDLQEPLRKIQAFGDRLKVKCDEAGLETGRDYLERMQNAASRMRRLIDDLLTFSRVISRTEPFGPVNLTTVVKEVLNDLEVGIEKSGAKIEAGELPTVEADAMQLRQLLQNLIGNALKFQPPDAKPMVRIHGRIVTLSDPGNTASLTRLPEVGVAPEEQYCELVIQDNGIGFEEKYLDRIFAVFQRLHGRQEYEGTGIGLAVCRRIVDRHGGKITAQSKPGEGATFIVQLPVRQFKQPTPPHE